MSAGRPKAIESPEKMWELYMEYKEWCKNTPILVEDYVGKDGMRVKRERERPLTMEGFENMCFRKGIINDLGDYFGNKNDAYTEFSAICRAIRKDIRQDQIEGGMANIYNPSITQRLNGLAEKTQNEHTGANGQPLQFIIQSDAGCKPITD
jgi:hypothetical protein